MLPRTLLGAALIPDTRVEMRLYQAGDVFSIKIPGRGDLMNSRMHGSEEALAASACERIGRGAAARLLVGGLGMGFTLAATPKAVGPSAAVVVAELVPEVVDWNRNMIGARARHPLARRRIATSVSGCGNAAST
jgi:spermidine synthase